MTCVDSVRQARGRHLVLTVHSSTKSRLRQASPRQQLEAVSIRRARHAIDKDRIGLETVISSFRLASPQFLPRQRCPRLIFLLL